MDKPEMIKAVTAVLFSGGEPVSADRLADVFEITPKQVEKLMNEVGERLEKSDLGFRLIRLDDAYQLATRQEYAPFVKKAFDIKRRTPLSPASLEVLAVIAYNQPVTKAFVEQVRGVDCSSVISSLVEKDLVEERGRLELPGRPLLYGTTKNFLRCFSLSSLDELPALPDKSLSGEFAEQLEVPDEV